MSVHSQLETLLRLEREQRAIEKTLLEETGSSELEAAVLEAAAQVLANRKREGATSDLERLADLCPSIEGPRIIDLLFRILNDDEPSVRLAAGEALLDAGYERYAEFARGVERLLDTTDVGPAKMEAPLLLAEIGEPGSLGLVKGFLGSENAEVVAGAIEAVYRLADPKALPAVEALTSDPRVVHLEDFEEDSGSTIGELATECVDALRDLD